MKVKLNTPIIGRDGTQMDDNGEPSTLGTTLVSAIYMPSEVNQHATDKQALAWYDLAQRIIRAGEEVTIDSSEVTDLRLLLKSAYNTPLISGQAIGLLENGGEPPDEDTESADD